VSFSDCMAQFTTKEDLKGDSQVYCSQCKAHQEAEKKLELYSTPPILVVHLKRLLPGYKLYTHVDAPIRGFDPTPFLAQQATPESKDHSTPDGGSSSGSSSSSSDDRPVYDLFAVVNHFGTSAGGHYLTYALNKKKNQWYQFDDSHVSKIDENEVISKSAYMLFYQRRGLSSNADFLPPEVREKAKQALTARHRKLLEETGEPRCPWCYLQ